MRSSIFLVHSLVVVAASCAVADTALQASSTWAATDALGRALPGPDECGPLRGDRKVGIFYFVWHGAHSRTGPHDITQLLTKAGKPDWGPVGAFHHWAEPELGYYLAEDRYVLRRHASLLADAGVDVAIIDVTNGPTYDRQVEALFEAWDAHRRLGNPTPQVAFLAHSHQRAVARHLYETWYQPDRFRELWFHWRDKPLLLARADELDDEVAAFFTLRESWAWSSAPWFGDGRDRWPWLDNTPQQPGWHKQDVPEAISVAVAQHPVNNIGRSHTAGVQPPAREQSPGKGIYFAEQWRRARDVDPPFVFVTGWNEWVAQRFIKDGGAGPARLMGQPLAPGATYFVDQFNQEFSRDIEPMRGGHGDNYYWQLAAEIRRYKGVDTPPQLAGPRAIIVDGDDSDWRDDDPVFWDTRGDNLHRDHEGWDASRRYVDKSGRNDIVSTRVMWASDYVFLVVQAVADLTPSSDADWMTLYVDTDRSFATGWRGYDLVVNRSRGTDGTCSVERLDADGKVVEIARATWAASGPTLELGVPTNVLPAATDTVEVHWCDNQPLGSVDFGVAGEHAPNRRFNYVLRRPTRVAGE